MKCCLLFFKRKKVHASRYQMHLNITNILVVLIVYINKYLEISSLLLSICFYDDTSLIRVKGLEFHRFIFCCGEILSLCLLKIF